MKTTCVDDEVLGNLDKDERLDIVVLREMDFIEKVCFVDKVVEGRDRNGARYVAITFRDKRGGNITGFAHNIISDIRFDEYLALTREVIVLKGTAKIIRGVMAVEIIDCIITDETGYTIDNFKDKNPRIEEMVEEIKDILERCSKVEYLSGLTKTILRCGVLENLRKEGTPNSSINRQGDLLEVVIRSCIDMLADNLVSNEGVEISKVGCTYIILLHGIKSFINQRLNTGSTLLYPSSLTSIELALNLMTSQKMFEGGGVQEKLKIEFKHLLEVEFGLSEPTSFLTHYVTSIYSAQEKHVKLLNVFGASKVGGRYNIDGLLVNRLI